MGSKMIPIRIVRCICGTFQSEIDMGDFKKIIALKTSQGRSHSRGEAIIAKSGILLGHNVEIERKIEFESPYKTSDQNNYQRQSQVDVVFSNQDETELALIEYETTDLVDDTVESKLGKWSCYYPNSQIKLLCVVIVNLLKDKKEQSWEMKDRTELVELFRNGFQKLSKKHSENSFSIISLNDDLIISYFYNKGVEETQKYIANW